MMGGVESVSRRWEELKWTKSIISRGVGCKIFRENVFFRGRCFKTLFGPNMHLGSKDRKDPSFHQMVDKILDTCSISLFTLLQFKYMENLFGVWRFGSF